MDDGNVVKKVLSDMEVAEISKLDFRRTISELQQRASSVLLLTVQWKEIEDLMDTSRKSLEERAREIEKMEERLKERTDGFTEKEERLLAVEAREKQLNAIRDSIAEKLNELEKEEKEFRLRREVEIEKRKEETECAEKSIMQLETVQRSVNMKLEELDLKAKKFDSIKNSVDESLVRLSSTEQSVQKQKKELDSDLKQLKECAKEFEDKRKLFGNDSRGNKQRMKDLEATYKKKNKSLELKEKMFKEQERKRASKEREIEKRSKELELREQNLTSKLHNPSVKVEPLVNDLANQFHLGVPAIGKSLQVYLNEHWKSQGDGFVKNQVDMLFNFLSLDPAKLVLDAMEGFHSSQMKNDAGDSDVVQRSCIYLLEQLMNRKPQIQPQVKQEATQLAINWLEKVEANPENINGILGFLLLLAVFDLASSFDGDVLLGLLERVVQYDQAPHLFQILGCTNRISGVVEGLIRKDEYFLAIRFICEFRLDHEFPPGPLLFKYMDFKTPTDELTESGNSPNVQKDFWVKTLFDFIIVLKYIEEKKLQSLFPIQELRAKIYALEKQLACDEARVVTQTQMEKPVALPKERLHGSSNSKTGSAIHQVPVAPPSAGTSTRAPTHEMSSDQPRRVKRQRTSEPTGADISTQDSGPCNQVQDSSENPTGNRLVPSRVTENMPNNHLDGITSTPQMLPLGKKDNCFLQEDQLLDACRRSSDPAKLLLDSVMALEPSGAGGEYEFKLTVSTNMCYFLLVELKKLPWSIKPLVQDEAKKLAVAWNSKLLNTRLDQMEVPCFLRFLLVYDLVSVFTAEELLNLLDTDYWRARAPDLCKSLGLYDEFPNFIQNLIQKGQLLKAVKHIYALDMVDKFAPVPLLNEFLKRIDDAAESSSQNAKNSGSPSAAQVASINRQIKKLNDAIKCIKQHKLQSHFPLGTLEERIHLLFVQRSNLKVSKRGKNDNLASGTSSSLPKDQSNKAKPSSVSTSQHIFAASATKPSTPTPRNSASVTPAARHTQTRPWRRGKKRRRENSYHRHYSQEREADVASNTSKHFNYDPLPRHPEALTYGHEYNYDQHHRSFLGNPRTGHSDNYLRVPHPGYDFPEYLYNAPFRYD